MTFNIQELIAKRQGENYQLHTAHINPQFAKVLRMIGFDRIYTRGKGAYLYDDQDRETIDFLSGYGVFNIGRNHPKARDILIDYLQTDYPALVQMEAPLLSGLLAEELKKRVPESLDTVYFTNSGAEGVEAAIKFAHCATKRPRILYCDHAFHGLTNGALSLNSGNAFREGFEPLLPGCDAIPFNDLEALKNELSKNDVAAFVVEPIQGKGVFIANDDYLREAAQLCHNHGSLLVLDEVQTGLGRTGKLFAMEYSGVVPDILILSKALSAGYVPVGAVLTSRDIYNKIFSTKERCVVHSSTFGQGSLAMVAGLACLHILDSEKLIENAEKMGALLLSGLQKIAERFEMIKEVRGRGLMIGIEFERPKSFKLKLGWDIAHKVNAGLFGQAIVIPLLTEFGILTQVAGHAMDIIKLIPPLVINESDVERFLTAFETVVERSHRFPGPVWELTAKLAKIALSKRS